MKIADIYRKKRPVFSVEFFPPKNGEGLDNVLNTLDDLKKYKPDYFSITSGALGSQRGGTLAIAAQLKRKYGIEALVHLTCTNKSKQDLENLLMEIKYHGLQNVLALRGDPEKSQKEFLPHNLGHRYAFELVKQIRLLNRGNYLPSPDEVGAKVRAMKAQPSSSPSEKADIFRQGLANDFSVAVAGYPEGHVECPDLKKNLEHLKIKIESGAEIVITQAFFDCDKFFKFRDEAAGAGINVPIVPGVFPLSRYSEINLSRQLGTSLPKEFEKKIEKNKEDAEAIKVICFEHNISLVKKLLQSGVPGIHFFTMNKPAATSRILEEVADNKVAQLR